MVFERTVALEESSQAQQTLQITTHARTPSWNCWLSIEFLAWRFQVKLYQTRDKKEPFLCLEDAAKQLAEYKLKLQEAERENTNHQGNVSELWQNPEIRGETRKHILFVKLQYQMKKSKPLACAFYCFMWRLPNKCIFKVFLK